jgi:hypothetical protein
MAAEISMRPIIVISKPKAFAIQISVLVPVKNIKLFISITGQIPIAMK